jgi:hypothetical protein
MDRLAPDTLDRLIKLLGIVRTTENARRRRAESA